MPSKPRLGKAPALMAALVALCLGGPVAAKDATLELRCTVGHRKEPQFQPAKITVMLDLNRLTATVSDDVMARSGTKSVPGRIEALNDKKITVTWVVKNVTFDPKLAVGKGGLAGAEQRLTILKSNKAFLVTLASARWKGRAVEQRADLACTVVE